MIKRILSVVLLLAILLTNTVSFAEESAIAQLSDFEKEVYDALLIMLNDFYNPSEVRILEMGEYTDRSSYRENAGEDALSAFLAGPSTIVLRLSGTNKLGGTLNHYYMLALNDWMTAETILDSVKTLREYELTYTSLSVSVLQKMAMAGEYVELADNYVMKQPEFGKKVTETEIGNINRALKEHWSNLGL